MLGRNAEEAAIVSCRSDVEYSPAEKLSAGVDEALTFPPSIFSLNRISSVDEFFISTDTISG
ncbi:hypothetical protein D3C83_194050 [compost metagenome]